MNVYVYKGTDRTSAIKPLIKDNKQASEYYLYKAPIDEGILIVAYPEKDKTTELAFEFWAGYSPEDDKAEEEEDDLTVMVIIAAAIAFLCIIILVVCIIMKRKDDSAVSPLAPNL